MSMTREERIAKNEIQHILGRNGYKTYSEILDDFDINLTLDPGVVGYMEPNKGRIVLNRELDLDQVSTIVRHEILHQYLDHERRLLKKLSKNKKLDFDNLDDASLNELKNELYSNKDFNIAGDYEISNVGYTDKDKDIIRNIKLNGQILTGLVTEDSHPDWVDMSIEDMYDELRKQRQQDMEDIEDDLNDDEDEEEIIIMGEFMGPTTFVSEDGTVYGNTYYSMEDEIKNALDGIKKLIKSSGINVDKQQIKDTLINKGFDANTVDKFVDDMLD